MQEVKRPKKPLIYFYVAMILAILVFNCLVVPYLAGKAIEDVDYGTFMTMTENGEIGKVQIQQNADRHFRFARSVYVEKADGQSRWRCRIHDV